MNLIMAIYEILIVEAASSRDYAMIAIKRLFFTAGSRSHEKLMDGYRPDSYPPKSTIEI